MEQAARVLGAMPALEAVRSRPAPMVLMLEVVDPEVFAALTQRTEGDDRERYALAALRVGVLALKNAEGHVDAATVREAGSALLSEVRELLSARSVEMTERVSSTLTQYLDPQSGVLPQRLQSLMRKDGELERLLRAHVGGDDSMLARSLASHLGEGSPIFRLLSPTDATGLLSQLRKTLEQALAEQREHILREFSLDDRGSALSRLAAEFSLDDDASAMSRLSKMLAATSEQIGKNLTLDDETSPLARLKRELFGAIEQIARGNVEFQMQVREALARLDTRKREQARTTMHGVDFEERLGALVAGEAQRLGDLFEATGGITGAIRQCKKGDFVTELGPESAAAYARIVWEAKEKQSYSMRAALDEVEEARRNRKAQVGVFVFSRKSAPEGIESLQRHGGNVVAVWDADDPESDVIIRAAYSLARALAVREGRTNDESKAAMGEIERSARGIERQLAYLDDIRKWGETVKSSGEKLTERSARMSEELRREVDRLDALLATMRAPATAVHEQE
jgi:hypothetical protein